MTRTRRRQRWYQRAAAGRSVAVVGLIAAVGVVLGVAAAGPWTGAGARDAVRRPVASAATAPVVPATAVIRAAVPVPGAPGESPRVRAAGPAAPAVGIRILHLVDGSRRVTLPGVGTVSRPVTTIVRYPAVGSSAAIEIHNAPPLRAGGPYPLVVFGHGFAVTPTVYARLLGAWTRAGYVVAALDPTAG